MKRIIEKKGSRAERLPFVVYAKLRKITRVSGRLVLADPGGANKNQ